MTSTSQNGSSCSILLTEVLQSCTRSGSTKRKRPFPDENMKSGIEGEMKLQFLWCFDWWLVLSGFVYSTQQTDHKDRIFKVFIYHIYFYVICPQIGYRPIFGRQNRDLLTASLC